MFEALTQEEEHEVSNFSRYPSIQGVQGSYARNGGNDVATTLCCRVVGPVEQTAAQRHNHKEQEPRYLVFVETWLILSFAWGYRVGCLQGSSGTEDSGGALAAYEAQPRLR